MKTVDHSDYENDCLKTDITEIFSIEDNELLLRIINNVITYMIGESIVIDGKLYTIVDTIQYPEEIKTVYFVEEMCEC